MKSTLSVIDLESLWTVVTVLLGFPRSCENSGADAWWLMDEFNLDLSPVARLGGYSTPELIEERRGFLGMTVASSLIQMVEKIAEKSDKSRIITKARVTDLIMNSGACTVCVYERVALASESLVR